MSKSYIFLIGFFTITAVIGSVMKSVPSFEQPQPTRTLPVASTPASTSAPSPVLQRQPQTLKATNSWFSSAYSFPSSPLFVYPGAFRIYEKGLGVSLPQVKPTPKTVFASYDEFCTVGFSSPVTNSTVVSYGDWNADFEMKNATQQARFSLVQGMPYVYFSLFKSPVISCADAEFSEIEQGIMVTRANTRFALQTRGEFSVTKRNENQRELTVPSGELRLIIFPESSGSAALVDQNELLAQSWNQVVDTQQSYELKDDTVKTTYSFLTSEGGPILTTIFPHHKTPSSQFDIRPVKYSSVLGTLELVSTSHFTVPDQRPQLLTQFVKVKSTAHQAKIKNAIRSDAARLLQEKSPEGVYFKGTWLGAVSTLIQLSDLYDMSNEKNALLERLNQEMQAAIPLFKYDQEKKMYIALKPEFGNEKGNDHHFHYGYYIRSAAILGKYKPELVASYSGMVSEMIGDIATTSVDSPRYPRLRAFSSYEGHSWADGEAKFDDGNNQESTSEAINAWYAVWLWGEVTGDAQYRSLGEWLYSQEVTGTQAYWFGHNNPFPTGYAYPIASLVWGGKRDFATWFSPDPLHVFGIQVLPVTPGSTYLTSATNGFAIEASLRNSGVSAAAEWGDIYVAYLAYFNPSEAASLLPQVRSYEGLKLSSLLYQTVYSQSDK